MKLLLLTTIFFALSYPILGWHNYFTNYLELDENGIAELVEILTDCAEESNLNPEIFLGKSVLKFPDTKEINGFYTCCAIKYGLCDDEADIDYDYSALEGKLSPEKMELMEKCEKEHETPCKNMFYVHQCYEKLLNNIKIDL